MSLESDPHDKQELILSLDAQRRGEIESIRGRVEEFLRGQIEIKHEMSLVAENQKNLKERFEQGVSQTIRKIDEKLDKWMIEWGKKQTEDIYRDAQIKEAKENAQKAVDKADFFVRSVAITVCGSLALVAIIWGVKAILH